jgi:hypothetical protein
MKKIHLSLAFLASSFFAVHAATITVTTTNNINPTASEVSLAQAFSQLQDGDTIAFNIPGPGPHYIETPAEGYALIRANDVHIDGYTQPGSKRNTNPILAANNAKIDIVLDSRNGGHTPMNAPVDPADTNTGFGDDESGVIGFFAVSNFRVEGLSIISAPITADEVAIYGIALAHGASGQISGCWIGIDPNGKDVAGPADAIAAFRYRGQDGDTLVNDVVVGVGKNSTNPRGEFNVIVGEPAIPIIIEGNNTRIAGNFLMVYPDGLHDYNVSLNPDLAGNFEGAIEIGRGGVNTVIGTDGDGVNDADERNVIGGTLPPGLNGYDHTIEFYSGAQTGVIVAGNYIGIGVDGRTRFTNGVPALNAAGNGATYRVGSDFNGVSDSLEGNVIANNWPAEFFADVAPVPQDMNFFDELKTSGTVSLRGNTLIDNFPAPVSPLKADAGEDGMYLTNYMLQVVLTTDQPITPIIDTNSTTIRLVGSYPLPNDTFTNVMLDVYIADPEGLTNGVTMSGGILTNGFVQGKTYLASYDPTKSPEATPVAGRFGIDISSLNLTAGTMITVTANYSQNAPKTTNDIALTSAFSDPVALSGPSTGGTISIDSVKSQNGNLIITWTGGEAPFKVEKKTNVDDPAWTTATTTSERTASVPITGDHAFFRVTH